MSALFRIVYAAHANGTHHKLALDALRHMQRGDADGWQRMFLKHVGLYLEGSKAPDVSFKDFKNHVLHVGDNYWGGAPEKVESWYGHLVTALSEQRWPDAAYAAGVLSHYYTDPIHPFHTGQTEAESSIHRAVEWSINRSYNELRALGERRFGNLDVVIPEGAHWLREMVCDGAEFSHRYYEKLIAHYDIHAGTTRPETGLDDISKACVAELLIYATDGFGHILDRAIADAGVAAPDVNLTIETVVAALNIPSKWIEKKLSNDADKAIVRAMYDELRATGKVEHALPEDDRIIRDLHAREVLAPKIAEREAIRAARVPNGDPADMQRRTEAAAAASRPIPPAARASDAATGAPVFSNVRTRSPVQTPAKLVDANPQIATFPPPARLVNVIASTQLSSQPDDDSRKTYLSPKDDLEAAPSIGTRMAEAFAALGIHTVGDFLGQNPIDMADLLDDRRFDSETLTDWQDQAHLVIDVPGLRGTHAQLLVGAGYRTAEAVAEADPVELSANILTFATTSDGRRILRDGNPPDIEKIKDWVSAARVALAA